MFVEKHRWRTPFDRVRGGWFGGTPREAAAAHGHLAVMQILIERGADVNVTVEDGQTLLARLQEWKKARPEALALLRNHGALTTRPAR